MVGKDNFSFVQKVNLLKELSLVTLINYLKWYLVGVLVLAVVLNPVWARTVKHDVKECPTIANVTVVGTDFIAKGLGTVEDVLNSFSPRSRYSGPTLSDNARSVVRYMLKKIFLSNPEDIKWLVAHPNENRRYIEEMCTQSGGIAVLPDEI